MLDPQGTRVKECAQRRKVRWQSRGIEAEKGMEGGDLCGRMSKKIRSQATELADLTERLQKQQEYSRLVEARLSELNPAHSLPVTLLHLGGAGAASGRIHPKRSSDENERWDHSSSRPGGRGEEPEDSVREGYRVPQDRLKDAARLIRHLRETLATRDAEANIAVERARKFEREANELRRTIGRGASGGGTTAAGDTENAEEVAGERHVYLNKQVLRLKRELQEQQEACTAAIAEGSKLKAALELRSRDLGLGPEGAGVAAELAAAKSTIDNLRAEIARFRLKPSSTGPAAYGGARKASGSFRHISSNTGIDRQPSQVGWASRGADRDRTGSKTRVAGDKTGTGVSAGTVAMLGAEKEALVDYVQDLLDKIKNLETALSGREDERAETSRQLDALREDLRGADLIITSARRESAQKEQELQEMRAKLSQMQEDGTAQQSEKDEMERLYDELLRQLQTAEEQKDELQVRARETTKREGDEIEGAKSLRDQLDQCLQRLADAESAASERVRHAEGEALARGNALSEANSRLAKLDVLETEIVARAEELKASRKELQALKDAVSISTSRLEKLETLETDIAALREELDRCHQEKQGIENSLAEEKSRTLHLVGVMKDIEVEGEEKRSKERAAIAHAERLQEGLRQKELKVEELTLLCEELEKRVASLQSGEEVKGIRRRVTEAFGLAERQDQLLEDTSAKLLQLKDDSRDLQEHLRRAKETSRNASNVLEPAVNAARSWLCFEHVDDGDDGEVITSGHGLAWHATEWQGRGDEEVRDVEDSLEALAREAAKSISRLLADSSYAQAELLFVDSNNGAVGSDSGGDCAHPDRDTGSSLRAFNHHARSIPCTKGARALECGPPSRRSRAVVRNCSWDTFGVDCHDGGDKGGGRVAKAATTSGCERNARLLRSPLTNGSVSRGGGGTIVNRPSADHTRSRGHSAAWEKDDCPGGGPAAVNDGGGGMLAEGGSISIHSCSAAEGDEKADARGESRRLVAVGGERHGGVSYTRRRGSAGMMLPDEESVRRMESILRGTGSEGELTGRVKSRRRSYLEERRRRSPIGQATKDNGGCWASYSMVDQSPSTTKIRQKIREAQATLRSLHSTTD